ncbi:hypothetical protein KSS87_002754 [Heliosperma pusillum]|nr:hypothetical protein KSS87_002754 [Heliosperma pusillum]
MSLSSSMGMAACQIFSNLINGEPKSRFPHFTKLSSRFRASTDVPDFLSPHWLESHKKRPLGPRLMFSAEEAVCHQLDALKYNDQPHQDYGIEVMYRFAGFDPFERSTYFGPHFDLGQFERFRRIFHHSSYRVLLGHKERKILSSLCVKENRFKQRIWVRGTRPAEEEIFEVTMVQCLPCREKLLLRVYVYREGRACEFTWGKYGQGPDETKNKNDAALLSPESDPLPLSG